MSQKRDSKHSTPKRHSPLIWGSVVLAVVMVLWIGGVIAVRGHGDPAEIVPSEGKSVVVEKTDDLSDRLGRIRTFPRWKVTEDGSLAGYIYTFPLDVPSPSILDRLLLAPRSIEVGVYVDNQYTIRAMRQLSPRWPQSKTAFTSQYVGLDLYWVLGTNDQGTLTAGGDLAGPGHQLMRTLLGSVYLADFGEYSFSRLVAEHNIEGLQLVEPFPAFKATSTTGQELETSGLRGKYTAIVFIDPVCGSCYDVAMELLTTLKTETSGWNVIAVVFAEAEISPVKRFVEEAGEQGAQVIIDPKSTVGQQMGHTDAPFAILLDKDTDVLYSGSALKQNLSDSDGSANPRTVYTVLEDILKGPR